MWTFLGLGLSMGLSAGISPGPLLALVITASFRSGLRGGLLVALAPLVTDAPIIALSVLLAGRLPAGALRWLGTAGGLFVIWMGVEALRGAGTAVLPGSAPAQATPGRELGRGVLVNALNPHPYLFWAAVGGPALVAGWRMSPGHALAFLLPFYGMLVGTKMALAFLVSRQAGKLSLAWYRRLLAGSGLMMWVLGGVLIWQMWSG
jgi:threonine/homoserine/homoserine lactone efflux protein